MKIEFVRSLNIIVLVIIICLVIYVAYKILVKKERPHNFYTPFDYITGQSDQEFHYQDEHEDHDKET